MESNLEEKEMLVLNDPQAVHNDILKPRSNYKWAINNKVPKNGQKNKVKETEFKVTETGEFHCLQCEFGVTTGIQRRHKMVQHILSEHRDVKQLYQCPYCPFKSAWCLDRHILSKHTSEKDTNWIKCDKCDYKCKAQYELNRHSTVHYNNGDLPQIELLEKHKCTICEKGFKAASNLRKHIQQIHKKQKPKLHCDHCDYTAPLNTMLKRHIEVIHTDSKHLKIHRCQKCSYETKFIHRLNLHMKAQHSTPVVCEICGYISHSADRLRLHQITHQKKIDEKELKYRCHKCDYKTYRLYSFKVHKLNHLKPSQIKYFYCFHCDFKAKRKDNLKTHVLRHFKKEEVTLKCYLCEFSTKKRQLLTDHLSMKHTNKNQ
ncbi:unnamed protein product [Ceutorhynchus assimilis]|uniref:C2H2-type domain-containing protein n=1 Tax=Ceutorhynchus assimilis TaxID=467358 RepID=A0A9N9QRD8_9CUCU|nr:unnamed protein product [Ceutorhynchus assimilis]